MGAVPLDNVVVISDSTGPVPGALADRYPVALVPLHVHIGDDSFRDGMDLAPDAFYRRLASHKGIAKTSQPSPGEFLQAFQHAAHSSREIVCLTISSKLSGTYRSAAAAAELAMEEDPGLHVHVVDTLMASAGHQFLTLKAAERAARGDGPQDVIAATLALRPHIQLRAVFASLTYLIRGGRIGKVQGIAGSLLGLRPILTIQHGEVAPSGVARGREAGLRAIESQTEAELAREMVTMADGRLRMIVVHADAEAEAAIWAKRLHTRFHPDDLWIEPFTPVVGVHSGPGLLGLVTCRDVVG